MTKSLLLQWRQSPMLLRVAPFLVFVGLTALQGAFGEQSRYWVYVAKTLAGAAMVWIMRPWVSEMRWKFSWEAAAVGLAVFVLWVGSASYYPPMDALLKKLLCPCLSHLGFQQWCATPPVAPAPWNPLVQFSPPLAWMFAFARLLGSTLIVPPLEEVFYRSFLYRYIARPDFEKVPLAWFAWTPFLMTSIIFGCAHYEWLPGILCGMLYQGLVLHRNRLGDAMTAHAITNCLLGLWVIWKGAWHFW